jgi:hypothetical protein
MAPKNRRLPAPPILVFGLIGSILPLAFCAWQDEPPAASAKEVGTPLKPTVLLLTNGHVFQGEILEDATGYYLKHKIGVKQFTRRNVAGVFGSMREAYEYQVKRLPKNDPDEHMKLALWCLQQNLKDQAKEQLVKVVDLSDSGRAKAMLFQLEAKAGSAVDSDVVRARADVQDNPANSLSEPRPLNQTVLEQLRNQQAPGGPPRILDLPVPLAVKRYQEFSRYVHGPLQNHCARCHDVENPNYNGRFRLVRTRTSRDAQNDLVLRANLEATLELVDPDNLPHSPLLSAAAMTHPPDGKPVLGGPTHPAYRTFLTWVTSLRDPSSPNNVASQPPAVSAAPGNDRDPNVALSEGFATGRGQRNSAPGFGPGSTPDSGAGEYVSGTPRIKQQFVGKGSASAPGVPGDAEFPDPRMPVNPSNPNPGSSEPPALPRVPSSSETASQAPVGRNKNGNIVEKADGTKEIRLPNGQVLPYVPLRGDGAPPKRTLPAPEAPKAEKAETSDPKAQINTKALDAYLKGRTDSKK